MNARGFTLVLATAAVAAGAVAVSAKTSGPCTDRSDACVKAAALSYIDALASNDPKVAENVRAAATVQKWEDGIHNGTSRAELVAAMKATQLLVADIRDVRLFVARGGRDVFAMYLADGGVSKQVSVTSHVMERISVSRGLITRFEIVECIGGPGEQSRPKPHSLTGYDFGLCLRGPRVSLDPPGISVP